MNKGLVYGIGIYEKGKHSAYENGKKCKAYTAWNSMLERCYSSIYQERHPTYICCTVCDEWLEFQVFADWHEENHPKDGNSYHLDKDLKIIGNKVYSPSTCLFVSSAVNKFTIDRGASRGEYLIGVRWHKQGEKFHSRCCNPFTKKQENLGLFTNELSAHLAWRSKKSELAYELAITQGNPEVRRALLLWKDALDKNLIHKI
jgi:hypothetical protein